MPQVDNFSKEFFFRMLMSFNALTSLNNNRYFFYFILFIFPFKYTFVLIFSYITLKNNFL